MKATAAETVVKDGVITSFTPEYDGKALLESVGTLQHANNLLQGKCQMLELNNGTLTRNVDVLTKRVVDLQAQLLAAQDRIMDLQGKLLEVRQIATAPMAN